MSENTIFGKLGILYSRIQNGYAVNGGGQTRHKLSIEEIVRAWNLPENITQFLRRASIYSKDLEGNFVLHVMVSDAPYSDYNFMVALDNPDAYSNPNDSLAAIVHEAPDYISEEYWRCCLKIMDFFYTNSEEFGNDTCFIIENTCREVSGQVRVPRSIKFIHAQVGAFSSTSLQPARSEQLSQDELETERELWKNISFDFVKKINSKCQRNFEPNLSNYPTGYNVSVTFNSEDGFESLAPEVNSILRAHHKAYHEIVKSFLENINDPRPQPSYVTYITVRDNKLIITISPILVSYGGGLDAAGIITARDPQAPSIHTSIEERREQAKVMMPVILEQ